MSSLFVLCIIQLQTLHIEMRRSALCNAASCGFHVPHANKPTSDMPRANILPTQSPLDIGRAKVEHRGPNAETRRASWARSCYHRTSKVHASCEQSTSNVLRVKLWFCSLVRASDAEGRSWRAIFPSIENERPALSRHAPRSCEHRSSRTNICH